MLGLVNERPDKKGRIWTGGASLNANFVSESPRRALLEMLRLRERRSNHAEQSKGATQKDALSYLMYPTVDQFHLTALPMRAAELRLESGEQKQMAATRECRV